MSEPYYFTEPRPDPDGTVPIILRTYNVRLPNGEIRQVNRFDFNLMAMAKAVDRHIQVSDLGWIRFGNLTLVGNAQDSDGRPRPVESRCVGTDELG